jgi:hypothetical protein
MQNIFTHDLSITTYYFLNFKLSVARAASPDISTLILTGVTYLQWIKKYSFLTASNCKIINPVPWQSIKLSNWNRLAYSQSVMT